MNIFIFLDVDGVLNSFQHPGRVKYSFGLSTFHLRNFFILQKAINAKIVISSSWRYIEDRLIELKEAGIDFIDTTLLGMKSREEEIVSWKNKHMTDEDIGIILDDDKVLTKPLKNFIEFNTDIESGLTLKKVNQYIIDIQKFIEESINNFIILI